MRIFLAGATGALGRRLVPRLRAQGHEIVGMTRSPDKAERLRAADIEVVVADALDRAAVVRAVIEARPEVVVHQATDLARLRTWRHWEEDFVTTNLLRTTGTDNLIAAARAAGARRFVAQSFAGWAYVRGGAKLKTEEDPLDPEPPSASRRTIEALCYLEKAVGALTGGDGRMAGLVLRYGNFYGPGTSIAADGDLVTVVRRRGLPIVGGGAGMWSFIHVDDAANATRAAIEHGAPGVYNVVDDEPAPVAEWLPLLAEAIGAKRPRRIPGWLGRQTIGEVGMLIMTASPGASNVKAKHELGWHPRYASWRDGFRTGLT